MSDVDLMPVIGTNVHTLISEPYSVANLDAEVTDDTSDMGLSYETAGGEKKYVTIRGEPSFILGDALIALRKQMHQEGKKPWSRAVFTLTPDGKFNLDVSYDD